MDILTVTPNPSLDLLHETDHVVWDDANRVAPPRRRPGGQGINVARAAVALGGTAHVLAPFGGRTGDEIMAALQDERISFDATSISGETRIFSALRETGSGRSLLINPRGPSFDDASVSRFRRAVESAIIERRPAWVACCGSLPPGFPPSFYSDLKASARSAGARFVADCDGEALRLAAAGGCDLLVPNRYEAERLTGLTVTDVPSARLAAWVLVERGTQVVIVTLGPEGAVLATDGLALHASVRADSEGAAAATGATGADGAAVGAGDSLLAGFLIEMNRTGDLRAALAAGVTAGTSVLSAIGSDLVDTGALQALGSRVRIAELGR